MILPSLPDRHRDHNSQMSKQNVIAIFDVGKTNKKLFLFDEQYKIEFEKSVVLDEVKDEDGFPCENLETLSAFIYDSFLEVLKRDEFDIKAVNFSAYGASFVYTGEDGKPIAPLYNYLKPYPDHLRKQFYSQYGGEENFAYQTASPVLGNLNSGMQLYRIKFEKPDLFQRIKYAFHLPQFLSYLICGSRFSDLTSIGCHTNLWDFQRNTYHDWVSREGLEEKLLPIESSQTTISSIMQKYNFNAGIGLHDSSAALIPYLLRFHEPFVLVSTGTWCISLNPFNTSPLTKMELENDCLCYLQYNGKPVKAARLLAGHVHDEQVLRIADHFQTDPGKYRQMRFYEDAASRLQKTNQPSIKNCAFAGRDMAGFTSDVEAYHQLISDIVAQQSFSTALIIENKKIKRIFVDGGFSKNEIYMNLLAAAFPNMEVYAASMAQATALGAALAIHDKWNKLSIPADIITLETHLGKPNPIL